MKVVIIGSGNVATVLGKKILATEHQIIQVAGRAIEKVMTLSSLLKTDYVTNLQNISLLGDIYIIAVSDKAIGDVASRLKLNNNLVVHTAAAVSMEVLKGVSANYGVLYPLQTLKQEILIIPPIPILVDANNELNREVLIRFSSSWADIVQVATDEERVKLHLAAVFANNFTNHLFAIAGSFCRVNGLDFNTLTPIIEETILRLKGSSASLLQTGPAVRNDVSTIEKHRELLKQFPDFLEVYNILTSSILQLHAKN